MLRFGKKTEKGIRVAAILVTVVTLIWLMWFFSDSLISCLLLVWKHMVEGLEVPVIGETWDVEFELITWCSLCAAVYQMLEEQYTQAERLRHDLKNHVFALRGLWEEQAWEKLGDYLKRDGTGTCCRACPYCIAQNPSSILFPIRVDLSSIGA